MKKACWISTRCTWCRVDLWYILPYEAARKTSVSFQFTPTREGHKYEKYLEAWHLLR
jgi:hypothetical protein